MIRPWLVLALLLSGCTPASVDNPGSATTPSRRDTFDQPTVSVDPQIHGKILRGKVIAVVDGDTIDILDADRQKTRIRLHGIDAPENGQPFGRNAKEFVSDLIAGRQIEVTQRDIDRYGRTIGEILIREQRLSVQLVQAGLAWHYVQFAPDDFELAHAELDARSTDRGLWSDRRRVPPWEWRKLSKEERDKLR
jgi:endonuclease YncB( thermonuclease family)